MSEKKSRFPEFNNLIFSTFIIISILITIVSPVFAASSTESASSILGNTSSGKNATDSPEMVPTATPQSILESSSEIPQLRSMSAQASAPADRGIDPSTLIVNLFDSSDLKDPVRTLRWRDPISFRKTCWYEWYPYNGCKLVDDLTDGENWSVKWEGKLFVPETGVYTFNLPGHDDGVRVLIDGSEIVDSGWRYPDPDRFFPPQNVFMSSGLHDIVIDYEQRVRYVAEIEVRWQGPGFSEEILPISSVGKPTIGSIELTQAIQEFQTIDQLKQDLDADGEPPIPIVSLKPAAARIYFDEVRALTYVRVRFRIPGVVSRNIERLMQPNCSINEQRLKEGGCSSIDVYFGPPEGDWVATVDVYDKKGNLIETHELPVTSRNVKPIRMVPVTVCDRQTKEDDYECESGFQLHEFLPLLRSMAPTHRVNIIWDTRKVHITDIVDPPILNVDWWLRLVIELNALWRRDGKPDQFYFGMVRSNAPDVEDAGGMAINRGAASVVIRPPDFQGFTNKSVAHETGHLMGRTHTNKAEPEDPCDMPPFPWDLSWPYDDNRIHEVGFDVSHGQPWDPMETYEIMSYCNGDKWASPYTYENEMTYLGEVLTSNSAQITSGDAWQVSGFILDDRFELEPIYRLEGISLPPTSNGEYIIEVQDSSGNSIHVQYFEPDLVSTLQNLGEGYGLIFTELVPYQENGTRLLVLDPFGVELASVDLTGHPPGVILFPLPADEPLRGEHLLEWLVLDPDSVEHHFRVEYFPGDGSHHILAWGIGEQTLSVDFDKLPACSENCEIQITASDGANTGQGAISNFIVPPKNPQVEITFPDTGSIFHQGQTVWFQANSWDPDDGYLPETSESWSSSIDGVLGQGDELPVSVLSEGRHQITFAGMDRDGNTATDTIEVLVDGTPPDLDLFVVRDDIPSRCVDVRIDASEGAGGSGLSSVEYSLDGGVTWMSLPLDALPYGFIIPETGQIHLIARAFDYAGNMMADDVPSLFISEVCSQTNQPPSADPGGPYTANEGETLGLDASGSSDPDNDIVLYEWDLDDDGLFNDATGVSSDFVFGDNGIFGVGVKVTDEVGQSDTAYVEVSISNLSPEVELGDDTLIAFAEGEAYLGQISEPQVHEALSVDPGSDDLTFDWSFGVSNIYFNDGTSPDPIPSPDGIFPFSVTDAAEVAFESPGLATIRVEVSDDDGGLSIIELPKLITGDAECTRPHGFWKHQFRRKGHQHIDESVLEKYLDGVNFASTYFSEVVQLTSFEEADVVLNTKGGDMRLKAEAQLLAAWLNFVNGAVGWDELINTDTDAFGMITFNEIITEIENILLDPNASRSSLELAKDLAESVNEPDNQSSNCEVDQDDSGVDDENQDESDVEEEAKDKDKK